MSAKASRATSFRHVYYTCQIDVMPGEHIPSWRYVWQLIWRWDALRR